MVIASPPPTPDCPSRVPGVNDAEHFFDGWKRDREYALETLRAAEAAGARCLVLCDTNGGALPHEVAEIVREVRRHVTAPLGIHVHNDGECAVANTLAAVLEGADHVQGTLAVTGPPPLLEWRVLVRGAAEAACGQASTARA